MQIEIEILMDGVKRNIKNDIIDQLCIFIYLISICTSIHSLMSIIIYFNKSFLVRTFKNLEICCGHSHKMNIIRNRPDVAIGSTWTTSSSPHPGQSLSTTCH